MLSLAFTSLIYSIVILSLFFIDFILGNGFMVMLQQIIHNIINWITWSVQEEAKNMFVNESPNVSMFFIEFLVLCLTLAILNKYKQLRLHRMGSLDSLLQESKNTLDQTNKYLEKWKMRRAPMEYSYLDEEPMEIKPLNLQVPILHMAIIDTLGVISNKPARGDAGDTIDIPDPSLLSVTSLIDDDIDTTRELIVDDRTGDTNITGIKNGFSVLREDCGDIHDCF